LPHTRTLSHTHTHTHTLEHTHTHSQTNILTHSQWTCQGKELSSHSFPLLLYPISLSLSHSFYLSSSLYHTIPSSLSLSLSPSLSLSLSVSYRSSCPPHLIT